MPILDPDEIHDTGEIGSRRRALYMISVALSEAEPRLADCRARISRCERIINSATMDSDFHELAAAQAELGVLRKFLGGLRDSVVSANDNLVRAQDALHNTITEYLLVAQQLTEGRRKPAPDGTRFQLTSADRDRLERELERLAGVPYHDLVTA
jgi:hypothetical protein